MASILWEFTRMDPNTTYIVQPWALRGYEFVYGSVTFTIGALIFLVGLLVIWDRSKEPRIGAAITVLMGVAGIGVAAAYANGTRRMPGGVVGWLIAFVTALVVTRAVTPLLRRVLPGEGSATERSTLTLRGARIAIIVTVTIILGLTVFADAITAPPVVWIGLIMALLVGLVITAKTPELAANVMLILSITIGGWTIALSAAAARVNLLDRQDAFENFSGQYKDTQITSGYFIALLGLLLAFTGAVSLWAKRRDIIISEKRASNQRAAAEASAAEIQAAIAAAERYRRETTRS